MTTFSAAEKGDGVRIACPHCGTDHPTAWSHCPNTGQPLHAGPALTGRVIAKRYEILGLLGEGGMGTVYEAEHLHLRRRVALKRLHPELASDDKAVRRFQREARAAGTIGHDHIVDVLDLGFAEDGAPYLAMELLVGESLADRLRRAGRLEARRTARIAGEILSALEAVHGRGVIHRDLKPDNIFLCRRGGRRDFVKVLDFGISKMRSTEALTEALTRTGVMMGTPHYMSAEQARGMKDLDHRVDIYAVGVILYECLAGKLPFQGSNYHALLQAILHGEPTPLREHAPTLPQALCDVIHKALARNREDRYLDAHSMHAALRPFGAIALHSPGTMRPPPRADGPTARMDSDSLADRLAEAGRTPADANSGTRRAPEPTPSGTPVVPRATEPTPFVARSPDYEPGRYESIRPRSGKSAETAPSWRPSSAPAPRPGEPLVKASFLLALEASIDDVHGAGSTRALIESDPKLRAEWPAQLLPIARLPFATLDHLLRLVEGRFGGGLEAVRVYGLRAAGSERMGTHRRLLEDAPTTVLLRRLGAFYSAYFSAGHLKTHPLAPRRWCIELDGADVTPAFLALLAGVFEHVFERAGQNGTRTDVVACAASGEERNAIELSWQ